MTDGHLNPESNESVIGRLLEEISWEGAGVRAYRDGGRGRENVLTAEVLWPLSLLPRDAFWGEVLRQAHGADESRRRAATDAEDARFILLPDQVVLPGNVVVQPDATVSSPDSFVLVEAKRIRRSSFQAHQLPRELAAVMNHANDRAPLLLLILGAPPPVAVQSRGRISIADAIAAAGPALDDWLIAADAEEVLAGLDQVVAWITWSEIAAIVTDAAAGASKWAGGAHRTIDRLVHEVTRAIARHA